jgi:hypothetical protein
MLQLVGYLALATMISVLIALRGRDENTID